MPVADRNKFLEPWLKESDYDELLSCRADSSTI